MVRETVHGCGNNVTLSSIDLLQERFRQLQRMKELRQEKELLRMVSESERYSPPTTHNYHHEIPSKKLSPGSELMMFLPPKPLCQLSLSLWPDHSHVKHADSNVPKSWFNDAPLVCTSPQPMKFEKSGSDIDTSLRL